jgi:hypothetical protein
MQQASFYKCTLTFVHQLIQVSGQPARQYLRGQLPDQMDQRDRSIVLDCNGLRLFGQKHH